MRTRLVLIAFLTVMVGACASGEDSTSSTDSAAPDTTASATATTAPSITDTTSEAPTTTVDRATDTTVSDRPLAPDFDLELGDGGTYTLSEGSKPVYLVFWAEW